MRLLPMTLLVATLTAAGPAQAYTMFPDRDDPERLIVLVEKAHGDLVPFGALPPPFDMVVRTPPVQDRLSFRWRYGTSEEEGLSRLQVDEDGRATIHFEFKGGETAGEDTLGAAAVLVDPDGKALHSFYVRADFSDETLVNDEKLRRVSVSVERPADWWRKVDGIAHFYMRYPKQRSLDEAGQQRAMRRAVWRFSRGAGTEQWQ
jgi:hypothetical protein